MMDQGASQTDHLERTRIHPGQERDRAVEQPDLRLQQEGPEITHHRRRQHHRQQDDRGPETVAAESAVDQQRQTEPQHKFERDRPQHEMRGRLHGGPHVGIGQYVAVVVEADIGDRGIGAVGPVVGEGKLDRPQQREDIDRQQQYDRRRDEQPGDGPVGHPAEPPCQSAWRAGDGLLGEGAHVGPVFHGSGHARGGAVSRCEHRETHDLAV